MIRRYLYEGIAIVILLVFASITTFAQVSELRGHVFMQQADGRKVPLAGAQIDVFRTDIPGKFNTTSDAKGEFVLPAVPFIGRYVVAVSHASATPNWIGGVRVGRDPIEITVTRGDGKRLTFEEIKAAQSTAPTSGNGTGGSESPAEKAMREELAKKNEIIARTFAAGNEALNAASLASKARASDDAIRKYTMAVAQYDEGLAADPGQPAILTNKAVALKARGVERYNATVRSKTLDDAGRFAGLETAKDDFRAAAEVSTKAVALIKRESAPTDPAELQRYNANKYAAVLTRAESMRLLVSIADSNQAEAASTAFKEYIALEPDPVKKDKAQMDLAQTLLDAGAADKALIEFRVILATHPDLPEANLGAGLAAYALDKTKHQDSANYLQRFVDLAPDTNPMKADARAVLDELKTSENVTPRTTKPASHRP